MLSVSLNKTFLSLSLSCLFTDSCVWSVLNCEGQKPSARDKLQCAVVDKRIYYFGGFGPKSADADLEVCLLEREKVLFNDAFNTFYLRLYGVRHMVKDHSDSEKGNPLPPHRLLLSINSKGSFICTIPQTG